MISKQKKSVYSCPHVDHSGAEMVQISRSVSHAMVKLKQMPSYCSQETRLFLALREIFHIYVHN